MDNSNFTSIQSKSVDEMDRPSEDEGIGSSSSQGVDECGMYGITRCIPAVDVSLERLGICPRQEPRHPQYSTLESRLESFSMWPLFIKLRPDALSDAGFYYTGRGDRTVCFQCSIGLKDWEDNDDPWIEHARFSPACTYLLQKKGRDFVYEVQGKKDPQPLVATSSSFDEPQRSNEATTSSSIGIPECSVSDVGSSGYSSGGSFQEEPSHSQEQEAKKPETKSVDDLRACKICYAEEVGVVFLPCGHLVSCVNCAPSLKTCAVCRQPFSATVRAYLS